METAQVKDLYITRVPSPVSCDGPRPAEEAAHSSRQLLRTLGCVCHPSGRILQPKPSSQGAHSLHLQPTLREGKQAVKASLENPPGP